jgi:hypothetical protein
MDIASPFLTWLLDKSFLSLEDNDNLDDILDTSFLFGDNMEETASHGTVNETSGHEGQNANQDTNAGDDTIVDALEESKKYVSMANDEWAVGYYTIHHSSLQRNLISWKKKNDIQQPTKSVILSNYVHYATLSDTRRTFKVNKFSREITTRNDGYLVEKPIGVLQPCNLQLPFVLTMEVGGQVVLVVMPTQML